MTNKKDEFEGKLLSHNYDNIQELDNPLPGWWLASFYGAIAFAAAYFVWFHMMEGHSIQLEHKTEMAEIADTKSAQPTGGGANEESSLTAALADKAKLDLGRTVYTGKCLPCHGPVGEGGIGPNLTDKFWIHGDGKMPAIATVVRAGVLDKGMPAWGQMMTPDEVINVTAYVKSLGGTNPPNGKAPQGNEVKE